MKKLLPWVLALLIALTPLCSHAEEAYRSAADDALAAILNGQDLQQWVDETVSGAAGSTMDDYVILLNRFGVKADFSAYVRAAAEKLQSGEISNPVSRQKCALSLLSCGASDAVPAPLADETIGKLGVMSYIYGLHLLNNGLSSDLWTVEAVLDKLLELQKEDGGWAVMGQHGDTDVTAMCIQALACNSGNNARIMNAISRGLEMLSDRQLENGGFTGSGRENAETSAQVVMALSSLGMDACNDERFIKSGISVMDALMEYHLSDGSFSHLPGDDTRNETATMQALQALYAYLNRGERLFDLSSIGNREYETKAARSWKSWALVVIGVLSMAGVIFALTRRHGRVKQLVFVLLIAAVAAVAVCMIEIESAGDYYNVSLPRGDEIAGQAYISIRCDAVAEQITDGSVPEDGVILDRTAIPFREGDSVFNVLTSAARLFKIHMEHEGGENGMAYVSGISYLYEYVYGDLSGWMYSVNGETPSIGCGSYLVGDGDEILWQYSTSLGEDLK